MKILIADDHELFLNGLSFILKENINSPEITTANCYTDVFNILEEHKDFDLIITDLAMPGSDWFSALSKIHKKTPDTPIIVISAVFDKEILQKTLDIGVSGYIPKTSSNNLIISAINLVLAGGIYVPHDLLYTNNSKNILNPLKKLEQITTDEPLAERKKLTDRQIDIIKCIANGLSNKEIAYKLNLTEGTIKVHITIILKILNVKNRTSALIEASKLGYITNDLLNN